MNEMLGARGKKHKTNSMNLGNLYKLHIKEGKSIIFLVNIVFFKKQV